MAVNLIAAVGESGQLGLNGRLPWHRPADLLWFREQTAGGYVVMGPKTFFEAAPRIATTANRIVIPWSRDINPHSLICRLKEMDPSREIWIAGGAHTYEAFMPFVERSFISHIHYAGEGDVHMPKLWKDA